MTVTALTAPERETIVTTSDADDSVNVWTAQRTTITRLRKDAGFTETRTGHHGSTEWAEFTIPAAEWSPAGVKRRRTVRPAQLANLKGQGQSPGAPHDADDARKARELLGVGGA